MKKNLLLYISIALAALYVVASMAGFGVAGATGGLVFRLITFAALLFVCSRVFAGVARRLSENGALLTGALGLSVLAVNEVYWLAYIYLFDGSAGDVTIAVFSRNCAYLFLIAAILLLLPLVHKTAKSIIGIAGAAAIVPIIIGVVADIQSLALYGALAVTALCVLPAVYLLITGRREAKFFAGIVISFCLLDVLIRFVFIYDEARRFLDIALSLYPTVYLLLGNALMGIKHEGVAENG